MDNKPTQSEPNGSEFNGNEPGGDAPQDSSPTQGGLALNKRKWRLNLFDIIFIACIVVIAALIIFFSNRSDSSAGIISTSSQQTVVYTVEFSGMIADTAKLIHPGDSLVDKIEQRAIGTVVSVDLKTATRSQKNSLTGERIISEVNGETDAIVVISAQASVTDSQISVNGFSVRVGTRVSINGPLYNGSGYIIDIERGESA